MQMIHICHLVVKLEVARLNLGGAVTSLRGNIMSGARFDLGGVASYGVSDSWIWSKDPNSADSRALVGHQPLAGKSASS